MKTKFYFLIVALLVQIIFVTGFAAPFLISAKDDLLVFLGFTLCVCFVPFTIWQIVNIINLRTKIAQEVIDKLEI